MELLQFLILFPSGGNVLSGPRDCKDSQRVCEGGIVFKDCLTR